MNLEITGKLVSKLPLQSGTSSKGNNWQKQEFVIETTEQYPKKICANLWGDKADQLNQFNIGDDIKVSFDLESREFNGRWYTDVKAWKIEHPTPGQMPQVGAPQTYAPAPEPQSYTPEAQHTTNPMNTMPDLGPVNNMSDQGMTDDLPF